MDDKKGSIKRMQEAFNQPRQTKATISSLMPEARQYDADEINKITNKIVEKITFGIALDRISHELQKSDFFEEIQKIIAKSFYNKFIEYSDCNDDIYNKADIWNISMISAKNILDQLCNQNLIKPKP